MASGVDNIMSFFVAHYYYSRNDLFLCRSRFASYFAREATAVEPLKIRDSAWRGVVGLSLVGLFLVVRSFKTA